MRTIDFDLETFRFGPGMALPKMVCFAWTDGEVEQLVLPKEGLDLLEGWLRDDDVQLVNHSIVYDLAVSCVERPRLLPLVIAKIRKHLVRCVIIREKMIANALGELKFEYDEDLGEFTKSRFDLAWMTGTRLGKFRKKGEDSWQKRYGELDGLPIEDYPDDARIYPLEDVRDALKIFWLQEEQLGPEGMPQEAEVLESAFWLRLASAWGSRTDPEAVETFCTELDAAYAAAVKDALKHGMMRMTGPKKAPKASRDMKAIYARVEAWHTERGLVVPRTETGRVATDRDVLTAARHLKHHKPDPALLAVATVVRLGKIRSTYAPILRHGARWPVTPDYNVPIETYRTSCSKPNMQNQPRKGGMRDCFVPRFGWWYIFSDFDTLEMRTLAQTCLDLPEVGFSDLAVALRLGLDPHVELASVLLGIGGAEAAGRYADGDPDVENARQFAKIGNYGLGGGMGPPAFVDYARGYGIEITLSRAGEIHAAYRSRWSEMPSYFRYCSELAEGDGTVIFPRSGLIRGKVRYTAICNGFFQHLASMGALAALRRASFECYLDEGSALYGSRVWYYGHDEIGIETPADLDRADAAARQLQQVMVEEMSAWCPDVPIGATAVISRRWLKGAKPVHDDRGRLVPCRQEGKRWVQDLSSLSTSVSTTGARRSGPMAACSTPN